MARPNIDESNSGSPKKEATNETHDDTKTATDILNARKSAMDDIVAGRPAPYFLASSPELPRSAESNAPANKQAGFGLRRYFENAFWIIAFVVLCILFIHEVNKATQEQARPKTATEKTEAWVCPILGKCGPSGTAGLGRW